MRCDQFVADHAAHHPVRLLCRAMGVSRSGHDAWRMRPPSARAQADRALTERIRQVHRRSRATYGSPRVQAALRADEQRCGRRPAARLRRGAGLRGVDGQRRRVRTTVPDRAATPAPDRAGRAFAPAQIGAPDRLWLADSSAVATLGGWRYLAVILDGVSRRVAGWARAEHLRAALVSAALTPAPRARRPAAGRVHHRDHGGQETPLAFGPRLHGAGLLASLGRGGDADDNAVVAAFFSSRKIALSDRELGPRSSRTSRGGTTAGGGTRPWAISRQPHTRPLPGRHSSP